jgi:FMN-dependent NADH-azoreductase
MNVLHVLANPRPMEESTSKQLAAAFFGRLIEKNPDLVVNNVDLYADAPPYLSLDAWRYFYQGKSDPTYKPSAAQEKASSYAREQGEALRQADVLVITVPMWAGSAPAIFKAWIDQVLQPGIMFEFGPEGMKPLHQLRRIVVLVASGDVYKEGDPRDGLTSMLLNNFSFIGVTEISYAWADGQEATLFPDHEERKQTAIEAAQELAEEIAELP